MSVPHIHPSSLASELGATIPRCRWVRGCLAYLSFGIALVISWFALSVVVEAAYGQGSAGGSVMLVTGGAVLLVLAVGFFATGIIIIGRNC